MQPFTCANAPDTIVTLLHSFIKRDGSCSHNIYIYTIHIYIYIQTLAQYQTAVVEITCLATLSNNDNKQGLVGADLLAVM